MQCALAEALVTGGEQPDAASMPPGSTANPKPDPVSAAFRNQQKRAHSETSPGPSAGNGKSRPPLTFLSSEAIFTKPCTQRNQRYVCHSARGRLPHAADPGPCVSHAGPRDDTIDLIEHSKLRPDWRARSRHGHPELEPLRHGRRALPDDMTSFRAALAHQPARARSHASDRTPP